MIGLLALVGGLAPAGNAEDFHGHAKFERVKGRADLGYVELYEYKAFLCPVGTGQGFSYHVGDPGTALHPYEGCITIGNVPPGEYALLTFQANFFPRGTVVPNITVAPGGGAEQDALEPIDYSGHYDDPNLDPPWDEGWADQYFQTFTAEGTSIVRVAFKSPGSSVDLYEVSVHDGSGGGSVDAWPQIGPSRTIGHQTGSDRWVAWRSGEAPTSPGQTYAVRIRDAQGSKTFSLYWISGDLYPQGTCYRYNGEGPVDKDLYMAVFSDSDGTIVSCMILSHEMGPLLGDHPKWAQSFTAQGRALAGFAVYAANPHDAPDNWDWTGVLSVHHSAPDGEQIGPTKTVPSAFYPHLGIVGCAYGPDEVPLAHGETYWIVFDPTDPSINPVGLGHDYLGGRAAFWNGNAWEYLLAADMQMNIYEYATEDRHGMSWNFIVF